MTNPSDAASYLYYVRDDERYLYFVQDDGALVRVRRRCGASTWTVVARMGEVRVDADSDAPSVKAEGASSTGIFMWFLTLPRRCGAPETVVLEEGRVYEATYDELYMRISAASPEDDALVRRLA